MSKHEFHRFTLMKKQFFQWMMKDWVQCSYYKEMLGDVFSVIPNVCSEFGDPSIWVELVFHACQYVLVAILFLATLFVEMFFDVLQVDCFFLSNLKFRMKGHPSVFSSLSTLISSESPLTDEPQKRSNSRTSSNISRLSLNEYQNHQGRAKVEVKRSPSKTI